MKTRISIIILLIHLSFLENTTAQFTSNSFSQKVNFAGGSNTQGIAVADFNNDGKPDIVVGNTSTSNIYVNINNSSLGTINSSSFNTGIPLTAYSSVSLQYSGDFDGDGKIDLLTGYTSSGYFSIWRNIHPGGTFSTLSFSSRIDFSTPYASTNIGGIVDVDLDGKLDVVIGSYTSNYVSVYRNTSTGVGSISFASGVSYYTGASSNPTSLVLRDMNSDGKPDLFVSCFNASILIYLNSSSLGSTSFTYYTAYIAGSGANFIRLEDFDSDGKPEIACSNYYGGNLAVFKNTSVSSTLTFNSSPIFYSVTSSTYTAGIEAGDLDYDGKPDIACLGVVSTNLGLLRNVSTPGIINSNTFDTRYDYSTASSPNEIRFADIDGDIRPDIIVTNYGSGVFSIYKNRIVSPEPTIQTSNISSNIGLNSITLNFTKGNGSKRLIVARNSTSPSTNPIDTNFYSANSAFGSGSNIGSNNYIVYSDTGTTATITGLTYGLTYTFSIYEYNGIGGYSNYLLTSPANTTQTLGNVYYSKSTGALNTLSTWGTNQDGTGTSPSSFSNPNSIYLVKNNPAPTINTNWIISGTGSYLIVGDGINALNFTIPLGNTLFADSISFRSNSTVTFSGGIISNKVYFDSLTNTQFTSTSAQNIPGFTYYNLIVSNSNKTLLNNCLVRNSLNLLCNINTGAYTITLGVSGTQPGTLNRNSNGSISGQFKRWFGANTNTGTSGLFPMLVGSNYRPASVEFTTAPTLAGTITTEFIATPPGNTGLYLYDFSVGFVEVNKASINGYWKLDPVGILSGTYTLTLTGTGFYGINSVSDLRIVKRQTAGAWTLQGTAILGTGTSTNPVVGRSGLAGFGEFTLAGDSTQNPLPVNWVSFNAIKQQEGTQLIWETTNEKNNSHFMVERKSSIEGEFIELAKIKAKNSISLNKYEYLDMDKVYSNEQFYRITQVDFDGQKSYSKTISVSAILEANSIALVPNPIIDFATINSNFSSSEIILITLEGNKINLKLVDGKIDMREISSGIYFIQILGSDGNYYKSKIIKN